MSIEVDGLVTSYRSVRAVDDVSFSVLDGQLFAFLGANGAEGSWDGLVGPGKAIDTDKLFVVSSNMLGSSYGSSNPAQVNPKTGKPYGPDFPTITLVDIVNAQKALLAWLLGRR